MVLCINDAYYRNSCPYVTHDLYLLAFAHPVPRRFESAPTTHVLPLPPQIVSVLTAVRVPCGFLTREI